MAGVMDTLGVGLSGLDIVTPEPRVGEPVWDVARLFPAQGAWTEEQYLGLASAGNWPVEFDHGFVEFLPMPTIQHQLLVRYFLDALRAFVEPRRLGVVLFGPLPTWIAEHAYREPDLLFVTNERHAASDRYDRGVDLALEVVSDDDRSRRRDHVEKVTLYAAAGVAEYWIVDPAERRVRVLALTGSDYAEHADVAQRGEATSKLLDGFSVDVAAAFGAIEGTGS